MRGLWSLIKKSIKRRTNMALFFLLFATALVIVAIVHVLFEIVENGGLYRIFFGGG